MWLCRIPYTVYRVPCTVFMNYGTVVVYLPIARTYLNQYSVVSTTVACAAPEWKQITRSQPHPPVPRLARAHRRPAATPDRCLRRDLDTHGGTGQTRRRREGRVRSLSGPPSATAALARLILLYGRSMRWRRRLAHDYSEYGRPGGLGASCAHSDAHDR